MARQPRYRLPGQPQHITQRGTNRSPIFGARRDYEFYGECLEQACRRHGCVVHAYAMMTNHVHLLVTPTNATGISKVMHSVGTRYAQYFNWKHDRTGAFWESRYRSVVIDSERYLLNCYRYIELNPVRAGITSHPAEYQWSSYHANALGWRDRIVTPHRLYLSLDDDDATRMLAYRALCQTPLDDSILSEIRTATCTGWALGQVPIRSDVLQRPARRAAPLPKGRRARIHSRSTEALTALPRVLTT